VKFLGCHWGEVIEGFVGSFVVEPFGVVQGLEFDLSLPVAAWSQHT
jgi:hypothetical protein